MIRIGRGLQKTVKLVRGVRARRLGQLNKRYREAFKGVDNVHLELMKRVLHTPGMRAGLIYKRGLQALKHEALIKALREKRRS